MPRNLSATRFVRKDTANWLRLTRPARPKWASPSKDPTAHGAHTPVGSRSASQCSREAEVSSS
jgi:hypothetical protein